MFQYLKGGKQLKKVIPFFQTHPLHHPQVIFHSPLTFPTRQDFLEIKKYVHKIWRDVIPRVVRMTLVILVLKNKCVCNTRFLRASVKKIVKQQWRKKF
jgi:hypothetical protein